MATPDHLDEELKLELALAQERSHKSLLAFTRHTMGPEFMVNWHHSAICRAVDFMLAKKTPRELLATWGISGPELTRQLNHPHPVTKLYAGMTQPDNLDKPIRNLQVAIAPRMGKSEIMSRRLPAWLLGRNPDLRIISASYSTDLSRNLGRSVAGIIDEREYAELFPGTRLGRSAPDATGKVITGMRNADMFEVVGRRGTYKNAGVGSALTGFGSTYGIVDDALRNRQDAESPQVRKTMWDWFQSVFYTRLEQDAGMFLIGTRWHQRDLAGLTLSQAQADPNAEQYFSLIFPSVLDTDPTPGDPRTKHGEVLWPWRASVERMQRIKSSISAYEFNALYQQRPAPPEGGIVKVSWFQYYDRLPEGLGGWTLSADLTFKDRGDYMVLQVWASKGADHYLVDQIRDRQPFTGQLKAFRALCAKYPQIRVKLVEDAANGAALIDTVKREINGVIGVRVGTSKEIRLDAVSPMIEAGNVFLPTPQRAHWVDGFLDEVATFPLAAHDDVVDALSLYLTRVQKRKNYSSGGLPIALGKESHWHTGAARDL